MPNYRRWRLAGGTYFFTVVCEGRAPLFKDASAVRLLGNVLRQAKLRWPFTTEAMVLLPDHLHAVWTLPRGDAAYSVRWAWIKKEFSRTWVAQEGMPISRSASRRKNRRLSVWQRRFWEHLIQDEEELAAYLDYIHWNPVKHGHALAPADWPYSTFHRWVKAGLYDPDWGRIPPDAMRLNKLATGE